MATTGISPTKLPRKPQGFTVSLASAIFEWLLILLLFVDAIFSYLLTRFAHYCDLQTPCFLCSRLDHVLGNEKLGFYWDLICRNHILEISSLVFCHVHNKLVDVHGMCESCLFSFATVNKSNAETYRLLVGKLGEERHIDLYKEPSLEHHNFISSSKRHCSCCNELLISTGQKLPQINSVGFEAAEFDLPLSSYVVHGLGDCKKRKDTSSGKVSISKLGNNGCDLRSHIGYTELKITSDTESDVPHSDDDDPSALVCETGGIKEDFQIQSLKVQPHIIALTGDLISQIPINPPPSQPEPSHLVSEVQSVVNEPNVGTLVAPITATDHSLLELTWQQAENKTGPSPKTQLISLDPSSSNAKDSVSEVSRECNVSGCEVGRTHASNTGNIFTTGSRPLMKREMATGTSAQKSKSLDFGDACKVAVGNRGRQLSGLLSEQWSGKDSTGANEDIKLLLSHFSASCGTELPMNDMSPRASMNIDELKSSDASGSTGLQVLQKRISLERNESGFDSLDGNIVSEIEGESLVDRLKRQVEHDRKSLGDLYKELDEERNASAIAANQAMAMITRLQEEKAALHMEGLQYLRMMEEQAEYDMEALQKANDLLAEKEKEVQDLEEEIDFYMKKFPNESVIENVVDLKKGDLTVMQQTEASSAEDNASLLDNSIIEKPILCDKVEVSGPLVGVTNIGTAKDILSEFEDEKLYILQCIKMLEKKLQMFSNNGVCLDLPNDEYSGNKGDEGSTLKKLSCTKGSDETNVVKEIRGSPSFQDGRVQSLQSNPSFGKENSECISGREGNFIHCGGVNDFVTFRDEVSILNDRLEVLEANQNFIENTINSLRSGEEGLKFVKEIVRFLQDLRTGAKIRGLSVT